MYEFTSNPEERFWVHRLRQWGYGIPNPHQCETFDHLVGKKVLLNGVEVLVAAIERFAHSPPWREDELIAILIEPAPDDFPDL